MPIYYFEFEAQTKPTHPEHAEHSGAIASCWIKRRTRKDAERLARLLIGEEHWRIIDMLEAGEITIATQNPAGLEYFKQAETDGAAIVFHIWPANAPDGEFPH